MALLPCAQSSLGTQEENEDGFVSYRGNERILFVDDEKQLARLGKTVLERLGYDVEACSSSVEALETFRANPERFDIVVTDQTMPKMTGVDLARELLRVRPEFPVILCTGLSDDVNEKQAKKAGILEYLRKPIASQNLARSIRRALAHTKEKELCHETRSRR